MKDESGISRPIDFNIGLKHSVNALESDEKELRQCLMNDEQSEEESQSRKN